jgi:hypothetical protein
MSETATEVTPNVDALCEIYCDAALNVSWAEINADLQTHMQLRDAVRRVATKMAQARVLAVMPLSPDALVRIVHAGTQGDGTLEPVLIQDMLRRLCIDR